MLFRQLFDQNTWTYTYLIADSATQAAVLVDPVLEQVERDIKLLNELELTLQFCLETHIHADHVTGTGKLRELTACEGIVPENANASCANRYVKDGEVLQVGDIKIKAIETHGHTDSHMSYLVNETHLLTGDALFIRGCGRTDFQSGNPGTLYDHVTQRLFTLPDETLVYPGHDYKGQTVSTIGEEKQFNPRFVGKDRDSFIEFMNSLDLPNPQKIAEAVPANEKCGQILQVSTM
jgi:glyoxylase-like metal-dependent hydrolase (beta-lactamase superfamily II)